MNLSAIEKIPFTFKRNLVQELCFMYLKIKKTSSFFAFGPWEVNDIIKDKTILDKRNLSFFEIILNILNPDLKEIIERDFLKQDRKTSTWYEAKYSKSTYYKLKHEAVDKFILLFFS